MRRTKREQETDQIWAQEEGKHRTWGHSSDIIPPPPPNRRIPRCTTSMGEGGWALWRPQGTWRQDRRPPGRRPFRDPWWSRELGRLWREKGFGRVASPPPRPKLVDTAPASTAGSLLPPPPQKKARQIAFEGPALEDTLGAQGLRSACKGLALEGTLGAQALHSVCEGPALGLSEQLLAGLPYALSAGLPYFLPAGLTYSLPSAWESRERRRACVG